MLLTPRYGDEPVLHVEDVVVGDHPLVRQRQRLGAFLAELPEADWHRPSRCEGWTVQDVVTHLTSTNGFWAFSIQAGRSGEPTRFLSAFDPVASPAQLVQEGHGTPVTETRDAFTTSNAALADVMAQLGQAEWETRAEAPPGHLPIRRVADHALWDCWVHERDIGLPLGHAPTVDPDEVLVCLRYAAALGRAFNLCRGSTEQGAVALTVSDPDAVIVVVVDGSDVRVHEGSVPEGAVHLAGDAVEILERLSMREVDAPAPEGLGWLTAGLAEVFDQPATV